MNLKPREQELLVIIYQLETNGVIVRNHILQGELDITGKWKCRTVCYRTDVLIEKGLLLRAKNCFYTLTEKGVAEAEKITRNVPNISNT